MDGGEDRFEAFRRKLLGERGKEESLTFFTVDEADRWRAFIDAHGKIVALLAMLLERENIVRAQEMGGLLATIATVAGDSNAAEGEILAIWAANVQDVAARL